MNKKMIVIFAVSFMVILFISVIALIYIGSTSFTIVSPPTQDSVLNKYVNDYYFPTTNKLINHDKCTNKNLNYGSNFQFTTSSLPISSSNCIYAENKNFWLSVRTTKVKTGSCLDLGSEVTIAGEKIFTRLKFIKKNKDFLFCKDISRGGYEYTTYSESDKYCKVKYAKPEPEEIEGKYYCDERRGIIYNIPCDSKSKKIIEKCNTGCEYKKVNIDTQGNVEVVKCKGEFKPSIKICSSDGYRFFETDIEGKLKIKYCSSCVNNFCKEISIQPDGNMPDCELVSGGSNSNNIFFYNIQVMPDYGIWAIDEFKTEVPFSDYTYNLYIEKFKGSCESTIPSRVKDVRIGFEDLPGTLYGWGQPPQSGKAGNFILDQYVSVRKWHFLLFHELGHIYTRAGHSSDGSIMDSNGGDGKFRQYQTDKIRINLNATM